MNNLLVTIVVPIYNESGNIIPLINELDKHCKGFQYEVLFVNDGSTDHTESILNQLSFATDHVHHLHLVRNYGHQMALKAGIDAARGDAVICMDGDLQHPPYLVPILVNEWQKGYNIVVTHRIDSDHTPLYKKVSSRWFYKFMNWLSDTKLKYGEADFRLIDRKVADIFKQISEPDLFLRGFTRWVGFKVSEVKYKAEERFTGTSKYSFRKMMTLAINGILSFSTKPLYLSIYAGLISSLISILVLIYAMISYFSGHVVAGWTSTLIIIAFFCGIQLTILGIAGLYIGRIFIQTKNRPLYIIGSNSYRIHEKETIGTTQF